MPDPLIQSYLAPDSGTVRCSACMSPMQDRGPIKGETDTGIHHYRCDECRVSRYLKPDGLKARTMVQHGAGRKVLRWV